MLLEQLMGELKSTRARYQQNLCGETLMIYWNIMRLHVLFETEFSCKQFFLLVFNLYLTVDNLQQFHDRRRFLESKSLALALKKKTEYVIYSSERFIGLFCYLCFLCCLCYIPSSKHSWRVFMYKHTLNTLLILLNTSLRPSADV